jgi:hypothetical protein
LRKKKWNNEVAQVRASGLRADLAPMPEKFHTALSLVPMMRLHPILPIISLQLMPNTLACPIDGLQGRLRKPGYVVWVHWFRRRKERIPFNNSDVWPMMFNFLRLYDVPLGRFSDFTIGHFLSIF